MKYVVHPVQVDAITFTYQIESLEQYAQDSAGMANGAPTTGFFPTKEEAIDDAQKFLVRAGIKEEDIIIQ